jgi:hypothetical protein
MKRNNEEHQIQSAIIDWARMTRLPYDKIYAIPNGGKRGIRTAIALKKEGVLPGMPDLCWPIARGKYHGLYIEVKTTKGRVSDDQKLIQEFLHGEGYCVRIARSTYEGIEVIEEYWRLGKFVQERTDGQ